MTALAGLDQANGLARRARWYNALTSNCTTNIRLNSDEARGHRTPFDWRVLLNGKGDELLYERRRLATRLPFPQLKEHSHINAKAIAAGDNAKFSQIIREDQIIPDL